MFASLSNLFSTPTPTRFSAHPDLQALKSIIQKLKTKKDLLAQESKNLPAEHITFVKYNLLVDFCLELDVEILKFNQVALEEKSGNQPDQKADPLTTVTEKQLTDFILKIAQMVFNFLKKEGNFKILQTPRNINQELADHLVVVATFPLLYVAGTTVGLPAGIAALFTFFLAPSAYNKLHKAVGTNNVAGKNAQTVIRLTKSIKIMEEFCGELMRLGKKLEIIKMPTEIMLRPPSPNKSST